MIIYQEFVFNSIFLFMFNSDFCHFVALIDAAATTTTTTAATTTTTAAAAAATTAAATTAAVRCTDNVTPYLIFL